jgi:hypothetical protein
MMQPPPGHFFEQDPGELLDSVLSAGRQGIVRADATAAFSGMTLATRPAELVPRSRWRIASQLAMSPGSGPEARTTITSR